MANGNKIIIESRLSNEFSHIGKGEVLSIVNSVAMLGGVIKVIGIDPRNSGCHHAEVEMVGNGIRIPGLTF